MVDGRTDEELVARVQRGEKGAFDLLVRKYQHRIVKLVGRYVRNPDDALDVSQEVFLRVFRTLATFRGQSSLKTWMFRIVVNQVRNRQRWWRRRHRSELISLEEHLRHTDVEARETIWPDRQLASKEAAAYLWSALERLPFDQRTALVLREVDGLA